MCRSDLNEQVFYIIISCISPYFENVEFVKFIKV